MVRHLASRSVLLAIVLSISLSLFRASGSGNAVQASTLENVPLEEHVKAYQRVYRQAIPVIFTTPETLNPVQDPAPSPDLEWFAGQVADGRAGVLRGVYVEGVMALEVVQQPAGDAPFVSEAYGTATQFRMAAENGVTGLLAHNYLSGELFFQLAAGQEVFLVYGDGSLSRYIVSELDSYQKLEPDSLTSRYIDLSTGEELSTEQIFYRYYSGADQVTFQTCIQVGQEWSWGVLFVTAVPVP